MRGQHSRRTSTPRIGDRVVLLDCDEVRCQSVVAVGETATIRSTNSDLVCGVAVDSTNLLLDLTPAAFLSSSTCLYDSSKHKSSSTDSPSTPSTEKNLRRRRNTMSAVRNLSTDDGIKTSHSSSSSVKTSRTKKTTRLTTRFTRKPKTCSSILPSPIVTPKLSPMRSSTSSVRKRKPIMEVKKSVVRSRKTLRRSDPEQRLIAAASAKFLRKQRECKSMSGVKSRFLGISDATVLPVALQNILDEFKVSRENAIEESLRPVNLCEISLRSSKQRIGNTVKIKQGAKWRRGYLKEYRESTNKFLVAWYEDECHSDDDDDDGREGVTRERSWLNIDAMHVIEYLHVVWAKMNGWPHWPAQVINESGNPNKKTTQNIACAVEFIGTHDTAVLYHSKLLNFNANKEELSKNRRMRKKLVEALDETNDVIRRRRLRRYPVLTENTKFHVMNQIDTLQRNLTPTQWLGRRLRLWWPLDNVWYYGCVRRYDAVTQLHFIVYDDTVEWINLRTERISLLVDIPQHPQRFNQRKNDDDDDDDDDEDRNTREMFPHDLTHVPRVTAHHELAMCFVCTRTRDTHTSLCVSCTACQRFCHTMCAAPLAASGAPIRCPTCAKCRHCNDVREYGMLLRCGVCGVCEHDRCVYPPLIDLDVDCGYVCAECRVCMSCNTHTDVTANEFTLCHTCNVAFSGGHFCRECFRYMKITQNATKCKHCERHIHRQCLCDDGSCTQCRRRALTHTLRPLVHRLMSEDKHDEFRHLVSDSEAPFYSSVVSTPICFSTIVDKLNQLQYNSLDEFYSDINLLWKNAFAYNPPTSLVFKHALRLQKLSASAFADLLSHQTLGFIKSNSNSPHANSTPKLNLAASLHSPPPPPPPPPSSSAAAAAPPPPSSSSLLLNHTLTSTTLTSSSSCVSCLPSTPIVSSWLDYVSGLIHGVPLRSIDVCVLCLSSGSNESLLFCSDCAECYHSFCINSLLTCTKQRRNFLSWRCPDCMMCERCGQADKVNELLQCDVCDAGVHLRCHRPRLHTIPSEGFCCRLCVQCRSCGAKTPGKAATDVWMYDFTMCTPCAVLYKQNKYCPVCDKVWKSCDTQPMVCCDECDLWIHNSCDAISDEQYQQLSDNPHIKYHCPICRYKKTSSSRSTINKNNNNSTSSQHHHHHHTSSPSSSSHSTQAAHTNTSTIIINNNKAPSSSSSSSSSLQTPGFDVSQLRAQDAAARSGELSLTDVYNSMSNMVMAVQQKRRRSRRRMLIDTARHLGQGNKHVKVLPRKAAFTLTPMTTNTSDNLPETPTHTNTPSNTVVSCATSTASDGVEGCPALVEMQNTAQRRCCLCHMAGDASDRNQARLLLVNAFTWVHARCVMWSAEVTEPQFGVLNINKAIARSKATKCAWCCKFGATVDCCHADCQRSFHFKCAKSTSCVFLSDWRTYCNLHSSIAKSNELVDVSSTERIHRKLLISDSCTASTTSQSNDQLWPGGNGDVVLRIGALSVECLGEIEHETKLFHTSSHIFPLGFRSHRIFWSYKNPGRRTLYTSTISAKRSASGQRIPHFSIIANDDINQENNTIAGDSPALVWTELVRRLPHFTKHNKKRKLSASGDTFAFGLSGPVFFGFGHPEVLPYITNLMGSLSCQNFSSTSKRASEVSLSLSVANDSKSSTSDKQSSSDNKKSGENEHAVSI